jgi:hypothetical protein
MNPQDGEQGEKYLVPTNYTIAEDLGKAPEAPSDFPPVAPEPVEEEPPEEEPPDDESPPDGDEE